MQFRPQLEALEERYTPVTNSWTGGNGFSWFTDNNWDQGHKPLSSEDVYVGSGSPTIDNDGAVGKSLVMDGGTFYLEANRTLTVDADVTINNTATFSMDYTSTVACTNFFVYSGGSLIADDSGSSTVYSATITGYLSVLGNLTVGLNRELSCNEALSLGSGSTVNMKVREDGRRSKIVVVDNVTLSSTSFVINRDALQSGYTYYWDILSYGGTKSGTGFSYSFTGAGADGWTWAVDWDGSVLKVSAT